MADATTITFKNWIPEMLNTPIWIDYADAERRVLASMIGASPILQGMEKVKPTVVIIND